MLTISQFILMKNQTPRYLNIWLIINEFNSIAGSGAFSIGLGQTVTFFCHHISILWKPLSLESPMSLSVSQKMIKSQIILWFWDFLLIWGIRVGWWISEVCADGVILKNLYIETTVQKDFFQKSIFVREITFEKWPKKMRDGDFLVNKPIF